MKGFLFTEFIDFAEAQFGADAARQMLAGGGLASGGSYRASENYDHGELIELATRLAALSGRERSEIVRRFGEALFRQFTELYPVFFAEVDSALGFMASINTYVHGELMHLYPDAQFPVFECRQLGPGRLEMTYRSSRRLADLAEGLIRGCIAHFGEDVTVHRQDLPDAEAQRVRFELTAAGA